MSVLGWVVTVPAVVAFVLALRLGLEVLVRWVIIDADRKAEVMVAPLRERVAARRLAEASAAGAVNDPRWS